MKSSPSLHRGSFLALALLFFFAESTFAQGVVCRRASIQGTEVEAARAKSAIGDSTTSDISEMKVYITVTPDGYVYAHSNFVTPGHLFPTKLASTRQLSLADIVRKLAYDRELQLGEDLELFRAIYEDIEFHVDDEALQSNGRNELLRAVRRAMNSEARKEKLRELELAEQKLEMARQLEEQKRIQEERERKQKQIDRVAHLNATLRAQAAFESRIRRMRNVQHEALLKHSTDDVRLFALNRMPQGMEVQIAGSSVFLTGNDVERMEAGESLGSDHALTKAIADSGDAALVLYTKEQQGQEDLQAVDRVAFAMQNAYRTKRIYRDPFSDATVPAATSLNGFRVNGQEDLVTLIAGDSFDVKDWNINGNLLPELKKKFDYTNVRVFGNENIPEWGGGSKKGVVVITGHIDDKLIAFVRRLGDAGYFRGNYVLLNTCNETPTRSIATEVVEKFGAVSTFCYDRKIEAAEVEDFLFDLVERVSKGQNGSFVDLINSVIHEYKLNGIWTICMQGSPAGLFLGDCVALSDSNGG